MEGGWFPRSHGRGSYKRLHEAREDWSMVADPARGALESPAPATWLARAPVASPGHGGFMLASNLSSTQQQLLPHSLSSSPLVPSHPPPLTTLTPSPPPTSPGDSSPPALWGELKKKKTTAERGGGGGGGGKDGVELPLRPLWQEGWRADGLICTLPRLHQHNPPTLTPLQQNNLPSLLDHPRDRDGHNPFLHSCDLLQHIREVEHISVMSGTNFAPSDLPPLPERFGGSKVERRARDDNLGTELVLPCVVNLDPNSVGLLLRKSAAAICSHAGYHSASLRALDTLAGVLGEVLSRLSQQLSIHTQQQHIQPTSLTSNIQDPLERCLWSCGIQGKAGLQKFWKTEVEAGTRQLQSEAARLHEQPVPSSLPPPPNPPRPLALSLSSLSDLGGEKGDEEISLEDTLATDMSIIAPATTPDPGGIQTFLPEMSNQEPEEFVLLTPDLPPRKRLRTSGSFTE